ncbi:MAG: VTT domain-containing protein [Rhizobiaceae bacterium]|nr:VTT domain-containing protein [Rhizobiaceae bacterium]
MKSLLKVMFVLAAIFASTFILGRVLGILTIENVRMWFEQAQLIDPIWVALIAIALLFADLFVAVPTLTIILLSGFFLGFPLGFSVALVGVSAAAFSGYVISRRWGEAGIRFLVRDQTERDDLKSAFQTSGPVMIMLSRAAPIVPEVTACMAGATRIPFLKYLLWFSIGTLPYVGIAA